MDSLLVHVSRAGTRCLPPVNSVEARPDSLLVAPPPLRYVQISHFIAAFSFNCRIIQAEPGACLAGHCRCRVSGLGSVTGVVWLSARVCFRLAVCVAMLSLQAWHSAHCTAINIRQQLCSSAAVSATELRRARQIGLVLCPPAGPVWPRVRVSACWPTVTACWPTVAACQLGREIGGNFAL